MMIILDTQTCSYMKRSWGVKSIRQKIFLSSDRIELLSVQDTHIHIHSVFFSCFFLHLYMTRMIFHAKMI